MSFPFVSQVIRSTRLYYHLLPRHHSRLPGRYTSPPVLSEELSSEKTKRSHHRRSTWRWHEIPNVCTLHQTPFSNHSTRGFINGHLQLSFALPKTFEKPLNPLHFHCSIIFLHPQNVLSFSLRTHEASQLSQSPTLFNAHAIIKRYPFFFFC